MLGTSTIMTFQDGFEQKWLSAIGLLFVVPPWVWMAVRTTYSLQFVTAHKVPFPTRTIRLMKVLALIVGAGGVFGAAIELGMQWYLALLPAGTVVFFSLKERVREIVPSKPVQDAAAYQSSWKHYRTLRSAYTRSFIWLGVAFLSAILILTLADKIPDPIGTVIFDLCLVGVLVSLAMTGVRQLKFFRWPCPRCGCAFNGVWNRPWFAKKCVYCGLPRDASTASPTSEDLIKYS
jgi:hypothetical protein